MQDREVTTDIFMNMEVVNKIIIENEEVHEMVEERQTGRKYSSSRRICMWIIGTYDSCHVVRGSTENNNLPDVEHPKQ